MLLLQTPTPITNDFHIVALVMAWTVTALVAAFAIMIIFKMVRGAINLQYLIAGADGDASLSRFQFLIFTFVIALGLFLIIVSANPPAFPKEISGTVLALLGISGGSYVTSKAVDANATKPTAGDTTVVFPPTQPSSGTTVVVPQSGS